ncbi:WhiB family transcriptional regulator [Streptomyces sp. NPDC008343]|uniref:WhiB family transcriptional regulator n=1 Tax=Streptomyces sp. NPDC008343 TaxID=3364828 RepID=UPI0036E61F4C
MTLNFRSGKDSHRHRRGPKSQLTSGTMSWIAEAACTDLNGESLLSLESDSSHQAQQVLRMCASCPVVTQCLDHARAMPERFGVWGGTTARERGWDKHGMPIRSKNGGPSHHEHAVAKKGPARDGSASPSAP